MGLLSFLFSTLAFAQNINQLPGFIRLETSTRAATDLYHEGRVITPDEARDLVKRGRYKDLSLIDPDPTTILWRDEFVEKLDLETFDLDIKKSGQVFKYRSDVTSPAGTFRFAVDTKDLNGTPKTFTIRVGPRMHNTLLRKALLEKIGFRVPNLQYLKNFRVKFDGLFSRDLFLKQMKSGNFVQPRRWVALPEDGTPDVIFKDAIALLPHPPFYDLAQGRLPGQVIRGRRLLNSMLIPYSLLDIPESINSYLWHPGRIVNGQLYLPYVGSREFSTTFEDARWVTRRILKLSQSDLKEVVERAEFPQPISELVHHKLISRRNFLLKILGFHGEFEPYPYDDQFSSPPEVVNGKVIKSQYEGYGVLFAHDDPTSPLGDGEMTNLFRSKAISNVLNHLIRTVNLEYIPRTNVEKEVLLHQIDLAGRQFAEFIGTGEISEIPFGFWSKPFYGGNLIASRDVVAGSYLGTDNRVQLADTVGFNVNTGVFALADGLPSGYSLSGNGQVFFTTTFTHLKPISSLRVALKEPLSNIVVNLLVKRYGETLRDLSEFRGSAGEETKKLGEIVKAFKDGLRVGESLLITKFYGGRVDVGAGYSLSERVELQAGFNASRQKFSRLHILRADENTIHVYKDPARVGTWGFFVGLDAEVQVFKVGKRTQVGRVQSHFFKVDIDPDIEKNPEVVSNLVALQRVIEEKKTDYLEVLRPPFVVDHKFKERSYDLSLFHYRWLGIDSVDLIHAFSPGKQSRGYVRAVRGNRKGKNYEELGLDVINNLLEEYTEEDIVVASTSTGDPGDTLFGRAKSRLATLDIELLGSEVSELYAQVSYKWKGWEIKSGKLLKTMSRLVEFYDFPIYPESLLAQTKKVQLYSLNLNISIYHPGIDHLLSLGREEVEAIFASQKRLSIWVDDGIYEKGGSRGWHGHREDYRQSVVSSFFSKLKSFRKNLQRVKRAKSEKERQGLLKRVAKNLVSAISTAERLVSFEGFAQLFGGRENLFLQSDLQGFKIGAENGDKPFFSNTLGRIGSEKTAGPLNHVQQKIGMTQSEFFIYWLLNRI